MLSWGERLTKVWIKQGLSLQENACGAVAGVVEIQGGVVSG
jgi:hypothetical protein